MTGDAQGLLAVWTDIPPELEDDFNAWYDREHLAERFGIPGFLSARRYIAAAAEPKYFALYETATVEVLTSPAYRRFLGDGMSEWSRRIMPRFVNNHRACCRRVARLGRGSAGTVGVLRIRPHGGRDARMPGAAERALQAAGIVGVHLWRTDLAVTHGAAPPAEAGEDMIVVIEGTDADAIDGALSALARTIPQTGMIAHDGLYRLMWGLPG